MFSKRFALHVSILLLVGTLASVTAFAGSAVIGSVAGSMNATIGGQALLPNSTLFSGQSLKVSEGAAVVMTESGSRLVFGRGTEASFLKDSNEVTVGLDKGLVYVYNPAGNPGLRVKVGSLSVMPARGFKTLGLVAMANGSLVVSAKEGSLRVEGAGSPVDVVQGKTFTLVPRTARSPQEGGHQRLGGVSTSTALEAGALGAGAVAAILAGIALSRAGDAKDNAAQADLDAKAATTAAAAATTAANAANTQAGLVGCALDRLARGLTPPVPSPFTPPASGCPFP